MLEDKEIVVANIGNFCDRIVRQLSVLSVSLCLMALQILAESGQHYRS